MSLNEQMYMVCFPSKFNQFALPQNAQASKFFLESSQDLWSDALVPILDCKYNVIVNLVRPVIPDF
jgi:hypothetical protein